MFISVVLGFGAVLLIFLKFSLEDEDGNLIFAGEDDNVISVIQDVGVKVLHCIVGEIDLPIVGVVDIFGDIDVPTPPWYEIPLALLLSILQLVAIIKVPVVTSIFIILYSGVYIYIKFLFLTMYVPSLATKYAILKEEPIFLNVLFVIYCIINVALILLILFIKNFLYLGVFLLLIVEIVIMLIGSFGDLVVSCRKVKDEVKSKLSKPSYDRI